MPITSPYFARRPGVGAALFVVGALGFALLTALVLARPFEVVDAAVARQIFDWAKTQPLWLNLVMRFFSAVGRDGIGLFMIAWVVMLMRRQRRRELRLLILGPFGVEVAFQLLSNLVMRHRPAYKDPFEILLGPGYPSGHAATNLVLVWLIVYLLWPATRSNAQRTGMLLSGAIYVVMVCFSRLFTGLHYPTDLLGGLLLGLWWGALMFTAVDWLMYGRSTTPQRAEQRPGSSSPGPKVTQP